MSDPREAGQTARVTIQLENAYQAARFIRTMRTKADKETDAELQKKWREIAWAVANEYGGELYDHRGMVKRPPDDDEVALRRVVDGQPPYPVLSLNDAREAFVQLNSKLSARAIGERLYVDRCTITRWRREYRNGGWILEDGRWRNVRKKPEAGER